jgi:hypothetical protein
MLNSENVPTAMVAIATAYSALPDPSRPHVLLTDHDMLAEVEATNGLLTGKTLATMKPVAPPQGPVPGGPGGHHGGHGGHGPTPPSMAPPGPAGPVGDAVVTKAVAMLRTGETSSPPPPLPLSFSCLRSSAVQCPCHSSSRPCWVPLPRVCLWGRCGREGGVLCVVVYS